MKLFRILIFVLSIFLSVPIIAQVQDGVSNHEVYFTLEGIVRNAETDNPVTKVNIEVTGGNYTTTNIAGEFFISVRIGDELIVRSDTFKTVYYTIENKRKITVLVENEENSQSSKLSTRSTKKGVGLFDVYIDSAKIFQKLNAKKSIEFITKALESVTGKSPSNQQNSIAFETLGDINIFWKQPDLAVSNYKRSLSSTQGDNSNMSSILNLQIKLAEAYRKNNNYQESIVAYSDLLNKKLTNYQKVEVLEGLGDSYKAINKPMESVANYQKGLTIASAHKITPKITDLNSKIGEAYAQEGNLNEANDYFGNSLSLAENENKKRAVEEKNKVADFYNQSRNFDEEIRLREETIEEIESMDDSESIEEENNSPLTKQRQNYKIANAYVLQGKSEDAIPFLEKSIVEADKKEDLIVEKDATRKLSEIYKDLGEFDKAAESYQKYVELVDQLYIIKEQEISQAERFRRDIAFKQNRISSLENERQLNESKYLLATENKDLSQKNIQVQRWVIISLMIIALLLIITAYVQYKSVKQQKYANNLLALKSLRTQMNPHFIFNALNSVNSFIASNDERAANKYLSEFSQLMRSVLENSEEDFIPLEKEIELLKLYVKLEHFRFKDKFDYTIIVDKNLDVTNFVIPPMLLQPYVENAVWHGLRYKNEKGVLEIHFEEIDSESVRISIIDNGIGRKKSNDLKTENQKKQKSKGMGNIQSRITILNEMYKDKVDVVIEDVTQNEDVLGTKVVMVLKKD
tara:strand:- start:6965 stop:9205 length:2241 start_codon:yes stop_codon:yes gene_type:complete